DSGSSETRGALRIARHLAVRSLRLGLSGRLDVVEFRGTTNSSHLQEIVPIEYKRGKPKPDQSDRVQLCAQALCLEEMLDIAITSGALFYATPRRRTEVEFDDELRRLTERAAEQLHALVRSGTTPIAVREPKCDRCSLLEICLPDSLKPHRSAAEYVTLALDRSISEQEEEGS